MSTSPHSLTLITDSRILFTTTTDSWVLHLTQLNSSLFDVIHDVFTDSWVLLGTPPHYYSSLLGTSSHCSLTRDYFLVLHLTHHYCQWLTSTYHGSTWFTLILPLLLIDSWLLSLFNVVHFGTSPLLLGTTTHYSSLFTTTHHCSVLHLTHH